jgi:hypothetical protein
MMQDMSDGGQAFPQLNSTGMTLRDWFAGQAITGDGVVNGLSNPVEVASRAYAMADAMLEARRG